MTSELQKTLIKTQLECFQKLGNGEFSILSQKLAKGHHLNIVINSQNLRNSNQELLLLLLVFSLIILALLQIIFIIILIIYKTHSELENTESELYSITTAKFVKYSNFTEEDVKSDYSKILNTLSTKDSNSARSPKEVKRQKQYAKKPKQTLKRVSSK